MTRTGRKFTLLEFYAGGTAAGGVAVNGSTLGISGGSLQNSNGHDNSGNVNFTGTIGKSSGDLTIDVSGDILLDADGDKYKIF